ncbi:MAG: DVU_1555 family C-GCAxxG-C-C protein [Bacillota bacterium]|jgi:hypothetical protein
MCSDVAKLRELLQNKVCCSSALVSMGLLLKGEENPQLVKAARGLCGGMHSQVLCGALSGAACMISLLVPEEESPKMVSELVQWFKSTFGESYGGIDCGQILGGEGRTRANTCPGLIEATYLQAIAMLEDNGFDFDSKTSF